MKKAVSIFLVLFLTIGLLGSAVCAEPDAENEVTPSESDEKSVPSDWAKEEAERAESVGITEKDKEYPYTEPITREEFCELVYNTVISVNGRINLPDTEVHFSDTDNEKVLRLACADIVKGKSGDLFAPNDLLTREEAATLIMRMVMREMPLALTGIWHDFEDGEAISDWAMNSVQAVCELGFMVGTDETHFSPKRNYTTEQAIATLARVYKKVRCFFYETPLGTFEYNTNLTVSVPNTIYTDAVVCLSKDGEEAPRVIEKPLKALTSFGYIDAVSFDDVAALLGGKWSLRNDAFSLRYDASVEVSIIPKSEFQGEELGVSMGEDLSVVKFPDRRIIWVNGDQIPVKGQFGGKVYDSSVVLYNGELYLPVQTLAEILGYSDWKASLMALKAS